MNWESLVDNLDEIIVENVKTFNDPRGLLSILDFEMTPFKPKHSFYITSAPKGTMRGNHAHKKTEQFLICMQGEIAVTINDGKREKVFTLKQQQAIYMPPLFWCKQVYLTGNDIALVYCSKPFEKEDYLNDYEDYQIYLEKVLKNKKNKK